MKTHKRITILEAKKSFLDLCDGDEKTAKEAYNIARKIVRQYDIENQVENYQMSLNDIQKNK
jgi:hypothetical protein